MMRLAIRVAVLYGLWASLGLATAAADEPDVGWPAELARAERIVFLGDSITYSGQYVTAVEAWLNVKRRGNPPRVINVGLPSETVSGLSEEGHADGRFPRPDLAERLERVLRVTRPDVVFACYGINCGIYQPWDEQRFAKYREGFTKLREQVTAQGATLIVVTPPFYDDQRAGRTEFSYNDVLGRYAEWLVGQREHGWKVIDLHSAMTAEVQRRRAEDPEFTFQPDAVHPNAAGHWFMAQRIIAGLGEPQVLDARDPPAFFLERGVSEEAFQLLGERMRLLRDGYLTAAGHKRPGIAAGPPLEAAEERATEYSQAIGELLRRPADRQN